MHPKSHYLNLRSNYQPKQPRLIIVAESPPASGKYFYDDRKTERVSEPLFSALMRDILHIHPLTKAEGLSAFCERGYLLVDATYTPVNKCASDRERSEVILASYPALRADLLHLTPDKRTKILLIKANICRLLESRLLANGFNVINCGAVIPFPSNGQQGIFRAGVSSLLTEL